MSEDELNSAPLIKNATELPAEAECHWYGGAMLLVDDLYYVHASTGVTYCPRRGREPRELTG